MSIVSGAVRAVARTADATTAAAGALGGAAVNGIVGGVQGVAAGARSGLSSGSHSTPAAALTLGAIGAAGLVEWPLLLGVGGTALVVHQLSQRSTAQDGETTSRPRKSGASNRGNQPRKAQARKSTRSSRSSSK